MEANEHDPTTLNFKVTKVFSNDKTNQSAEAKKVRSLLVEDESDDILFLDEEVKEFIELLSILL